MVGSLLALVFSGAAQGLVSPPVGWLWLHLGAWVPALLIFSRVNGPRALAAGWLVGTSASLTVFYWLAGTTMRYGGLDALPALLVLILHAVTTGFYVALFAWGFGRVRRFGGDRWPFAIAAWFCALEFLNPQVFPFFQGSAWYQTPQVFLVSALTGTSGVSFLVLCFNAMVLQGLEAYRGGDSRARRAWRRNAAILTGIVVCSVSYSLARAAAIDRAARDATSLRVAVIQPNHTIERRAELRTQGADAFADDMVAQSRQVLAETMAAGGRIDVFVWPEGALRDDPADPSNLAVLDFARETGIEVWTGASHHESRAPGQAVSHNSAFRVLADGAIDKRYDKNILVPFGEYVPFRDVIPGFDRIPAVANFEAGRDVPLYASGPARFVFLICYEAIQSGFVRAAIGGDANLLVNVTVDAWYGDTSEQSQHLMLAAAQSAMNGLPMLRATSTGISAVVDARGVITARTGVFTRDAIVAEIRPLRVSSPYARWGEWFAWSCVVVSAVALARSRARKPSSC